MRWPLHRRGAAARARARHRRRQRRSAGATPPRQRRPACRADSLVKVVWTIARYGPVAWPAAWLPVRAAGLARGRMPHRTLPPRCCGGHCAPDEHFARRTYPFIALNCVCARRLPTWVPLCRRSLTKSTLNWKADHTHVAALAVLVAQESRPTMQGAQAVAKRCQHGSARLDPSRPPCCLLQMWLNPALLRIPSSAFAAAQSSSTLATLAALCLRRRAARQ